MENRQGAPLETVIEPAGGGLVGALGGALAEAWRARELLGFLVWRDLRVRYRQTLLGAAWAVLRPLLSMVVFTVIFGRWVGLEAGDLPYPVFVYAGLLPWTLFNGAVSQASMSLLNNTHLFTKVYFPRILLPAGTVGVVFVDFLLAAAVYGGILLYYGFAPPAAIVWLPAMVLLTLALSLGWGLLLAGPAVMYRDLRALVPFLLQTWMYLSPVIYPVTIVPPQWRWLLRLNPLVGIIDGFRACLLGTPVAVADLAAAAAISLAVLAAGAAVFTATERRLADIA